MQLVKVNPHTLAPGMPVIFRNAGTGPPRNVTVMPRGPIGQFVVKFEAGFTLAVNESRELFRSAP
ncbi:hypothetical protein AB0J20_16405 [Micromonospora costi]|uniref:hypothetical protein n=1 Tax=Micromonospora costi TaxID=1530042 RepID=UPI0033CBEECD